MTISENFSSKLLQEHPWMTAFETSRNKKKKIIQAIKIYNG